MLNVEVEIQDLMDFTSQFNILRFNIRCFYLIIPSMPTVFCKPSKSDFQIKLKMER